MTLLVWFVNNVGRYGRFENEMCLNYEFLDY